MIVRGFLVVDAGPYRAVSPCSVGCGWATWWERSNRRNRRDAALFEDAHLVFVHPTEWAARHPGEHIEEAALRLFVDWPDGMIRLVLGRTPEVRPFFPVVGG